MEGSFCLGGISYDYLPGVLIRLRPATKKLAPLWLGTNNPRSFIWLLSHPKNDHNQLIYKTRDVHR